jgi:hypothetical protein
MGVSKGRVCQIEGEVTISEMRRQSYRLARDLGNVQAASHGPASFSKRVLRRKRLPAHEGADEGAGAVNLPRILGMAKPVERGIRLPRSGSGCSGPGEYVRLVSLPR